MSIFDKDGRALSVLAARVRADVVGMSQRAGPALLQLANGRVSVDARATILAVELYEQANPHVLQDSPAV